MDIIFATRDFISRSQRVMAVATRPRKSEYEKIAKITAAGMVLIGVVGLVISLLLHVV
ncbi:protein translocase SEC61 complex subunit gamma [Candidatus Micrarchaeota archaeon]|nr:protein translocase SEC61 complex subunit gamma [Candidatus Micrarchaeota archaeon]